MGWAWDLLFIVLGIVLLYFGGEGLVGGARHLAIHMGVTPLLAGVVVVAWATSMPEAAASLWAVFADRSSSIALANVIGSNIANVGLVLAIASIVRPIKVERGVRSVQMPLMLAAGVLVTVMMFGGEIGRIEGAILLCLLIVYLWFQLWQGKRHQILTGRVPDRLRGWGRPLFYVGAGVVALVVGAGLLIEGSVGIAQLAGISERVIGLSIVAIGTSLPELATSVIASYRGHPDIALGNVMGSNVFNSLFIAGLIAFLYPLQFAPALLQVDAPVMLAFTLLLWAVMIVGLTIHRWQGVCLLLLYMGYLIFSFV